MNHNVENVYENMMIVKNIMERATTNPKFNKYITKEKVNEALSNIIICMTDEQFDKEAEKVIEGSSKEEEHKGRRAFQAVESRKIVFRNDCSVEEMVHEIVHYSSLDDESTGIIGIGKELIQDEKNKDWNNLNQLHIDVLNEAMTHYITQELIPEYKVDDAYNYGAEFLKNYSNASGNEEKIFNAYFNKDKEDLDYIAKDINKENIASWHDIIEICGVYQFTQMMIFKQFEKNFKRCEDMREKTDIIMRKIKDRDKLTMKEVASNAIRSGDDR